MNLRKVFLFFITFIPFFAFPRLILAQENDHFATSLHTTVTVYPSGLSHVKHDFQVTNKKPTTYVSQYGLKISSSELKNVSVINEGELITPEVVTTPRSEKNIGYTSIGITFPNEVVGEGKSRSFTVSYNDPDVALISGSVLEVALPPQANLTDYDTYKVTLVTPTQFGLPTRASSAKYTSTSGNKNITTTFNQLDDQGVFALFGQSQIFDLNLSYQLENPTNNLGITQIALPPDTTFQKMYYQSLEPLPEEVEIDPDGNWIATYQIEANSLLEVNLTAKAQVTLEPNQDIPVPTPNDQLLAAQEFWPVRNSQIKELAQEHQTAEEINKFVTQNLSYNTARALNEPERMGALEVLSLTDQAVCQEFTDLFITISRAADIPARRIAGFAYAQNTELRPLSLVEDILHSWPEFYDTKENIWRPIDPTWENTTGGVDYFKQFDLNHVVFAINGHSSTTPYPAGSYKDPNQQQKTVEVEFGADFPEAELSFAHQITPRKILGIPLPGIYSLEITNTSPQAWYHLPIAMQTVSPATTVHLNQNQIEALIPYQTIEIPFSVETDQLLALHSTQLQLQIADEQFRQQLTAGPQVYNYLDQPYILAGAGGGLVVVTLIIGSLLVFRRRR